VRAPADGGAAAHVQCVFVHILGQLLERVLRRTPKTRAQAASSARKGGSAMGPGSIVRSGNAAVGHARTGAASAKSEYRKDSTDRQR